MDVLKSPFPLVFNVHNAYGGSMLTLKGNHQGSNPLIKIHTSLNKMAQIT